MRISQNVKLTDSLSFKLTAVLSILDQTSTNGQSSLPWIVDVQTGLSTAVAVPNKGRHSYSVAELKKFIYETGRTYGILQYDKEQEMKRLVWSLTLQKVRRYGHSSNT